MAKVKINDSFIAKAREVFGARQSIMTGDGLTRTELRVLERHGFVERVRTAGKKKWSDSTATMTWAWFRKGSL